MLKKIIQRNLILPLLSLVLILTACGKKGNAPSHFITADAYNHFRSLIAGSDDRMGEYVGTETLDGQNWHVYEKEELRVLIREWEEGILESHCMIYQGEQKLETVTIPYSYYEPVQVQICYADITGDGQYDAILHGENPGGTPAGYDWIYAYDPVEQREITLFDLETGYLTEKQEEQMLTLLIEDADFTAAFGEEFYLGDAGFTYVDEMGHVYYETAVWRQIGEQIGSVMIWFSYDAEENCFNVSDYFYCKRL